MLSFVMLDDWGEINQRMRWYCQVGH